MFYPSVKINPGNLQKSLGLKKYRQIIFEKLDIEIIAQIAKGCSSVRKDSKIFCKSLYAVCGEGTRLADDCLSTCLSDFELYTTTFRRYPYMARPSCMIGKERFISFQ